MFAQIIAGTPKWVFVLFFVLLGFGIMQSRPRAAGSARVIVLPVLMVLLSIGGVLSSFGTRPEAVLGWLAGFAGAIALNQILRAPRGVTYDVSVRRFQLPGTWIPLVLMMAIYFSKYAVGVTLSLQPHVAHTLWFAGVISFLFGVFSGTFFARFLCIWAARRAPLPRAVVVPGETLRPAA